MKARVFLLLILGGCASGARFNWPEKNPFASYETMTLDEYPKAGLHKLDLVFSANVFGETEPCGCASGPKGGLDRRLNYLRMTPSFGDRLVLDAGNAYFATESLDPSRKDFLLKRAQTILESGQRMGIRAQNIGYLDLSAGADFLKNLGRKNKVPFVSASLVPTSAEDSGWISPYIDIQVSQLNVRITGLTAGRKDLPAELKLLDPETALKRALSGSRPDFLVILSDMGRIFDEELLERNLGIPTVIIGSRDLSSLDRPVVRGSELLVQPQFRGQQWGRLKILTNPKLKNWFNLGQAGEFHDLWNQLKSNSDELAKKQAGSERTAEMKNQSAAAYELLSQGPGDEGEKRSVFAYELIDMGSKFMKTNELSKKMKEVSEP